MVWGQCRKGKIQQQVHYLWPGWPDIEIMSTWHMARGAFSTDAGYGGKVEAVGNWRVVLKSLSKPSWPSSSQAWTPRTSSGIRGYWRLLLPSCFSHIHKGRTPRHPRGSLSTATYTLTWILAQMLLLAFLHGISKSALPTWPSGFKIANLKAMPHRSPTSLHSWTCPFIHLDCVQAFNQVVSPGRWRTYDKGKVTKHIISSSCWVKVSSSLWLCHTEGAKEPLATGEGWNFLDSCEVPIKAALGMAPHTGGSPYHQNKQS